MRNKQRERRERGNEFQEEIRYSWRYVPNTWRMRISDGVGGTRPADELVLTTDANILAEHKRTEGSRFELSFLRPNQIRGLIDFDEVIPKNRGLVFVSFHNPAVERDEAYVIRLVTILRYLSDKPRRYIELDELRSGFMINGNLLALKIHRRLDDPKLYDLREVPECCRYL